MALNMDLTPSHFVWSSMTSRGHRTGSSGDKRECAVLSLPSRPKRGLCFPSHIHSQLGGTASLAAENTIEEQKAHKTLPVLSDLAWGWGGVSSLSGEAPHAGSPLGGPAWALQLWEPRGPSTICQLHLAPGVRT